MQTWQICAEKPLWVRLEVFLLTQLSTSLQNRYVDVLFINLRILFREVFLQWLVFLQVPPIAFKDFLSAFTQVRASVSESDLKLYVDWNKQFGSWAL